MTSRIGILGGTFDPVHNGHLALAAAAGKLYDLSEIMLLPAAFPPHKLNQKISDFSHRNEMLSLAVKDRPLLYVSSLEELLPSPSYTIDTLRYLNVHSVGNTEFYFIIGADAFLDIRSWYRYKDVLKASHFIVFSRSGFKNKKLLKLFKKLNYNERKGKWYNVEYEKSIFTSSLSFPSVSSSVIRNHIADGETIEALVPSGVSRYITDHGLYLK